MKQLINLSNGIKMPIIGLGTSTFPKDDTSIPMYEKAIDVGYRHFDTAFVYQNETFVGQALVNAMAKGIVKRDELFVTTKLSLYLHKRQEVLDSIHESLRKLQLDYVDLFLVHSPFTLCKMHYKKKASDPEYNKHWDTEDVDHLETWKGMEDVYKSGLAKAIGLSNYTAEQSKKVIVNAEIKPTVLQVECHAYLPQFELEEFCRAEGMVLTAYAPFGSPSISTYRAGWKIPEGTNTGTLQDNVISEIANHHGRTTAQICLRWLTQRNIAVLPKSANVERLNQNLEIFDFELTKEEMNRVNSINIRNRIFRWTGAQHDKYYPFKNEMRIEN